MRWCLGALVALVLLHKPDGDPLWVAEEQVVAVFALADVGKTATVVQTQNGTFYVRETPEKVARKLGWKP